jgi:hypothetical protein
VRLKHFLLLFTVQIMLSCSDDGGGKITARLVISDNHRYLAVENGDPFFWLDDTGWRLPGHHRWFI